LSIQYTSQKHTANKCTYQHTKWCAMCRGWL